MNHIPSRLISQPFPESLSPEAQDVLRALETHLSAYAPNKVLIKAEPGLNTDLFFTCMDRLLRSNRSIGVLVLTSVSAKAAFVQAWQTVPSLEDGRSLSTRFPISCSPIEAVSQGIRVCIAALRETQLQLLQHSEQLSGAFDIVLAYGIPPTFSPAWQQVIEKFTPTYLIGFCNGGEPALPVIALFEKNVIGYVAKEQATHRRNVRPSLLRFL